MPAKRLNIFRKCKHCDKEVKRNITPGGRNKGYYETCGSDECTSLRYRDLKIRKDKGIRKDGERFVCEICDQSFVSKSSNHRKFCMNCVPSREWRMRASRYGIGKCQWDVMLASQRGRCALCEREAQCVDHCHEKKKNRGLLCHSCNTVLGRVEKESGEWLKRAMAYLYRYSDE